MLAVLTLPALAAMVKWPGLHSGSIDQELSYGMLLGLALIRPGGNLDQDLRVGWLAMLTILILGIVVAMRADRIIDIAIFMLGLSSAEITANWGQWWWWRFNGSARLAASLGGPVLYLSNRFLVFPRFPELGHEEAYLVVLVSIAETTALWIGVALLTQPDPEETLVDFYRRARPPGWWGPIARKAELEDAGSAPIFSGLGIPGWNPRGECGDHRLLWTLRGPLGGGNGGDSCRRPQRDPLPSNLLESYEVTGFCWASAGAGATIPAMDLTRSVHRRPGTQAEVWPRALCLFLAAILLQLGPAGAAGKATSRSSARNLALRGYYFTFMRMPTYGLPQWKEIVDTVHQDGGNLILLWLGGGFRSKKFPITWEYNRDHKNIQEDFVRELIDYAHRKDIRILLALTPFSYDGVNQYAFQHPELKAVQRDGKPVGLNGIDCWGYALNPSRPAAQTFMLEYAREMLFDFYPNADGLMLESSDYAICYCPGCQGRYYEREFQFVRAISQEVWSAKPEAMVLIYPHYFSSGSVPGFEVQGATQEFDPRWTLFFTPHSAHLDSDLIRQARTSLYWDSSPAKKTPRQIQQGRRFLVTKRESIGRTKRKWADNISELSIVW